MTAMTAAAGAAVTIDWVDWSAMGRRVVGRPLRPGPEGLPGPSAGWAVDCCRRAVRARLADRPHVRGGGRRRSCPGWTERTGVRELSVPPTATVGPDDALTDMVTRNAAEHPT